MATLSARVAASEGGNFWPGLLVGGVVGGALAYIFAPQISRYLLGEEAQASGEGAVEETNTKLGAEIAALNSEIDKVKEKMGAEVSTREKIREADTALGEASI